MSMYKEKAMKILELNHGFTADDLKKAYRIMAAKYHTDNLKTGNNEKMQEVNEARDYLKCYVSDFSSCDKKDFYTSFDVNDYKREKLKELERRVKFDFKKYPNIPFNIRNRILIFKEYVKGCIKFGKSSTKSEVDEEFTSSILPELYLGLKNIEQIFYQEYGINKNEVTILLNYDDDLETFFDTLMEIKKISLEKKLDRKITEYKDKPGYTRLAKFIEKFKLKCINERDQFATDDSCIKYFDDMVLNYFNAMNDYKNQISKIEDFCSNISDDRIKQKLDSLLIKFNCIENFMDINKELVELQGLAKEYKEKQERLKISSYYGMILNRYTDSLQHLNGVGYLQEASTVNNIFKMCIELMQDVENGKRDIVDLEILYRVTFSNYKQDLELFSKSIDDSEIRSFDDNKILLKRKISQYFESEIKEWQDAEEKKVLHK